MKAFSAGRRATTASSTLVIGTAAAFIVSVAVLAFVVDEQDAETRAIGVGWTLRGHVDDLTLPPSKRHHA